MDRFSGRRRARTPRASNFTGLFFSSFCVYQRGPVWPDITGSPLLHTCTPAVFRLAPQLASSSFISAKTRHCLVKKKKLTRHIASLQPELNPRLTTLGLSEYRPGGSAPTSKILRDPTLRMVDTRGNTGTHRFILVPAVGPYVQQRGVREHCIVLHRRCL